MHRNNVALMQHLTYTSGMEAALGGYLKTLRIRQGLTKAEVLRRVKAQFDMDLDRSTLYRAETGAAWPDGDKLTALLGVIGGQLEDLVWIRKNADAKEVEGVARAEQWLRESSKPESVNVIVQARSRADATEIADELEELAKRIRSGRE